MQDLEDEIAGLQTRISNFVADINTMKAADADHRRVIEQAKALVEKYTKDLDNVRNNREYDSLTKEIEYENLEIELAEKRLRESANKQKIATEEIEKIKAVIDDKNFTLEEKKNEIEQTLFDLSFDPEKLSEIEERISFLFKLKGKYGETEEEILEYLQNSKDELETLVNLNLSQDEIIAKLEADKEILLEAAEKLSLSRKHAASEFEVHVKHELTFLDMPNVEIAVNFEPALLNLSVSVFFVSI